jgi:hypothetical protein
LTHRLIALAFVLFFAPSAFAAESPIRLFVFTAPPMNGLVDRDSSRRADSLTDLVMMLKHQKKTIALVSSEAEADVLVEVIGSAYEATGDYSSSSSAVPYVPGWRLGSVEQRHALKVRVQLRVPRLQYTTDLESMSTTVTWRTQASNVANQINRWVRDNRARLIATR